MNTTKVQVYMLDTWAYSYELETRATVLATQIKMDMGQAREAHKRLETAINSALAAEVTAIL